MKRKVVLSCFALLGAVSLVLGACNYPGTPPLVPPTAQSNSQISVSIFSPYNGSVFSLDAPISLTGMISQLSASPAAIGSREFLVNGVAIASTRTDASSFYGNWAPSRPGEYYVQGKVALSDGTVAISEPVRVCVLISLGGLAGVGGYLGPCPLATPVPDHASSGNPSLFAVAAPNPITFSHSIECPMTLPMVTFIANIDDPQDQVALVMVSFHNASSTYLETQYLNWVTTRPVNQKEYRVTLEIADMFSNDTSIHWYMQAFGRIGEVLQTTQDVITINQAECSSRPLQIASPTISADTPTLTLTPTPTQGILYIVSPTKKPKKNNGNGNPAPPPATAKPCIASCP